MNKIFEIKADGETYIVCAKTEGEAMIHIIEEEDKDHIDSIKEVPECEWDSKEVRMYEDNDTDKELFYMTYRELHSNSDYPETIASTDIDY